MSRRYIVSTLLCFVFISSCDNYEFIDKNTRFNKRTGENEILYSDGKWMTKSERNKYEENLQKIEEFDRQSRLKEFPLLNVVPSKIDGNGRFENNIYRYTNFEITIENKTDWKFEEIDFVVYIYSKSDSTLLTKREFTGKSYGKTEGLPFSETKYYGKIPDLLDSQYYRWYFTSVRGVPL